MKTKKVMSDGMSKSLKARRLMMRMLYIPLKKIMKATSFRKGVV